MFSVTALGVLVVTLTLVAAVGADVCPAQPAVGRTCPADWQSWHSACYRLMPGKATWDDARSACREIGGQIAAPGSMEENEFIVIFAMTLTVIAGIKSFK